MAQTLPLDLELIKKRSIAGVAVFTLRTFFISVFSFFAIFLLTIILDEAVYGIFVLVSAILNLLVYFSDIGLAAALVQKKEEPARNDLVTTFTIQQAIVVALVTIGLIFSSAIAAFYRLDKEGLWLLRVLFFSLILSSLKTIPSIILERQLKFTRLVIPQISENIVFYTVAVILALAGFGVTSFTWAVLARGVIGLVLIYLLAPWLPAFGFDKTSAKKLVSFGIPFQLNSILALLKDDLLTVFLGKILPFAHLGFVGWSQKWAYAPMRFFMDSINRVTFPAYSRLQEEKKVLGKAIEKSLFFVAYFVYPAVFGVMAIAPQVIAVIPNYGKWGPALPLLYLFLVSSLFSAISTTLTNTLFAIGRPKTVLNLMTFWTVATWVLTYPAIVKFGFLGVGLAALIVAVTSLSTIYFVKREIPVSVGKSIFGPLLVSGVMFFLVSELVNFVPKNIPGLILTIIAGVIIYLALSLAIFRKHLTEDALTILRAILGQK